MEQKTVRAGDFIVSLCENGKVEVFSICTNTIEALRKISKEKGFEYDEEWNTRTFGKNLFNYLIDNNENNEKTSDIVQSSSIEEAPITPTKEEIIQSLLSQIKEKMQEMGLSEYHIPYDYGYEDSDEEDWVMEFYDYYGYSENTVYLNQVGAELYDVFSLLGFHIDESTNELWLDIKYYQDMDGERYDEEDISVVYGKWDRQTWFAENGEKCRWEDALRLFINIMKIWVKEPRYEGEPFVDPEE